MNVVQMGKRQRVEDYAMVLQNGTLMMVGADGKPIDPRQLPTEQLAAALERIVACWNAFYGVDTAEVTLIAGERITGPGGNAA